MNAAHRSRLDSQQPTLIARALRASAPLLVAGAVAGVLLAGCHDNRIPLAQYLADQENQPANGAGPGSATSQPSGQTLEPWAPGAYKVGSGDVLGIAISGLEKLGMPPTHQARVTERGEITLPMAGKVQVAGQTLDQVETAVKAAYVPKFMKDTDVSAQVVSYEPISVMVIGDVMRLSSSGASLVELKRNKASVLQALLAAGGAQDYTGEVTVIPARAPEAAVTYNLKNRFDLVRAARPGSIEEADLVVVNTRPNDSIFVEGLVNRPGPVPMPPSQKMSILQAIGAAGGTMLAFEPREATLMRHDAENRLVKIKVDLDRVKDGKDPDMLLAAGDILLLPHNAATRVEEYIARSLQVRIGTGIETTYNPWTLYYLRKENSTTGGYFSSLTNQLQTGGITPLPTLTTP
jgi:protein involved in polysaccharide export with SLBB domain